MRALERIIWSLIGLSVALGVWLWISSAVAGIDGDRGARSHSAEAASFPEGPAPAAGVGDQQGPTFRSPVRVEDSVPRTTAATDACLRVVVTSEHDGLPLPSATATWIDLDEHLIDLAGRTHIADDSGEILLPESSAKHVMLECDGFTSVVRPLPESTNRLDVVMTAAAFVAVEARGLPDGLSRLRVDVLPNLRAIRWPERLRYTRQKASLVPDGRVGSFLVLPRDFGMQTIVDGQLHVSELPAGIPLMLWFRDVATPARVHSVGLEAVAPASLRVVMQTVPMLRLELEGDMKGVGTALLVDRTGRVRERASLRHGIAVFGLDSEDLPLAVIHRLVAFGPDWRAARLAPATWAGMDSATPLPPETVVHLAPEPIEPSAILRLSGASGDVGVSICEGGANPRPLRYGYPGAAQRGYFLRLGNKLRVFDLGEPPYRLVLFNGAGYGSGWRVVNVGVSPEREHSVDLRTKKVKLPGIRKLTAEAERTFSEGVVWVQQQVSSCDGVSRRWLGVRTLGNFPTIRPAPPVRDSCHLVVGGRFRLRALGTGRASGRSIESGAFVVD